LAGAADIGSRPERDLLTVEDVEWLQVVDTTQVADARRRANTLSRILGFSSSQAGKIAIVVSELASNLVRHSEEGELLLRRLLVGGTSGIEVLALDVGPGIANLQESLRDGYSTAGSQGIGLGAAKRLSSFFDIYSRPDRGTAVVSRFWPDDLDGRQSEVQASGVAVPLRGEPSSGDAWGLRERRHGFSLLVVDGLGHGPVATTAAREALRAFSASSAETSPAELLGRISAALQPTRGATGAIAEVDFRLNQVSYAGIGNIRSVIFSPGGSKALASMDGILGHNVRQAKEFSYPWPAGGLLVMASDGLDTRWDLADHPGLASHHPSLIAGVLFRAHRRSRDDATVVVARGLPRSAGNAPG
jgi:anti-sigma regulatory factor (Ser/Thr protein kinase)